jgi:Tol biopolymer transport system component
VQQADGKGVVFERGGQIYHQAYQRIHNHGHPKVVFRGHNRLVSAGIHGAGNGPSAHPSVSDNGSYAAFESSATNLCTDVCTGVSQDRNGPVTDIFRRSLHKRGRGMMQMASFSVGVKSQGNGPSNNAAISGAGQFIAFDSAATNLRPSYSIHAIDPNGPTRDIYLWNSRGHGGAGNVSRESRPGVKGEFNGPSVAPAISSHGNYLAFASDEVGQLDGDGPALPNILMRFLGGK